MVLFQRQLVWSHSSFRLSKALPDMFLLFCLLANVLYVILAFSNDGIYSDIVEYLIYELILSVLIYFHYRLLNSLFNQVLLSFHCSILIIGLTRFLLLASKELE